MLHIILGDQINDLVTSNGLLPIFLVLLFGPCGLETSCPEFYSLSRAIIMCIVLLNWIILTPFGIFLN